MKRKLAGGLAFVLLFVGFAALVAALLYADILAPAPPATSIAVVLYGEEAERWKNLEAGVGKACLERGIEKPVLVLSGASSPEEQKRQIQSAVAGGAEGLLVAACHSVEMGAWLEGMDLTLPVVMVETGAGQNLVTLGTNDREMGRVLAKSMAEESRIICLPGPPFARQSMAERHEGFMEEALRLGLRVEVLPQPAPAMALRQMLAATVAEKQPGALVLLDNESLEEAIEAAPAAMVAVDLYGVGGSAKVLHATDTGLVKGLCFANEYAMGYLAVNQLAARMNLSGAPPAAYQQVPFVLANRENMFTPPVEEQLFPAI